MNFLSFLIALFLTGIGVSGLIEWLKTFIPVKVKENNKVMSLISGVIAAAIGVIIVLSDLVFQSNVLGKVLFIVATVAFTQIAYNYLLQTFKAIKTKLTGK